MKPATRFPGLFRHAKALGCSHSHLYRVLVGERPSPILKRYQALLAFEKTTVGGGESSDVELMPGTTFSFARADLHELLITAFPDSLKLTSNGVEALKKITLRVTENIRHGSAPPA